MSINIITFTVVVAVVSGGGVLGSVGNDDEAIAPRYVRVLNRGFMQACMYLVINYARTPITNERARCSSVTCPRVYVYK